MRYVFKLQRVLRTCPKNMSCLIEVAGHLISKKGNRVHAFLRSLDLSSHWHTASRVIPPSLVSTPGLEV